MLTIRRVAFGAVGIFLFLQAFRSFRLAGWNGDTILTAGMGLLFAVLAASSKGG